MKHQIILLAWALLLATGATAATRHKTTQVKRVAASTEISNFEINEMYKSASATYKCLDDTTFGKDIPVYTEATAHIQWPVKISTLNIKNLQDSLIHRSFEIGMSTIDSTLIAYINHPIGFGDTRLERVKEIPAQDSTARVYMKHTEVKTVGFCERFIVFKIEYSDYAGGAHPSYTAQFLNYNLMNNEALSYKKIFKPDCEKDLLKLIEEALCSQYYVQTLDKLKEVSGIFTDNIFVSHNIYLTGTEIVFHYNPYDIGPWSIGSVEARIPVGALDSYFTDEAKAIYK